MFQYIPEFKLSGDGFWIYKAQADEFKKNGKVELDGYWNEALEYMKKEYDIEFEWNLKTSKSGGYEYYCMEICRIFKDNVSNKVVGSNENYLKDKKEENKENQKERATKDKKKTAKAEYHETISFRIVRVL